MATVRLFLYANGDDQSGERVFKADTLHAAVLEAVKEGHAGRCPFHVVEAAGEPYKLYWAGRPLASLPDGRPQREMTQEEISGALKRKGI